MKNVSFCARPETAESSGKRTPFSASKPATFAERDCYTFETFARDSREIHTAYYYHYERTRAV